MAESRPKELVDFEILLSTTVQQFVEASAALGDPLAKIGRQIYDAFVKSRDLINFGLYNPEPEKDHVLMDRLMRAVAEVLEMQMSPQDDELVNHYATIKGALPALGWMIVKPAPTQYIRDMHETSQYYGNRVLLSFKGNDKHINWVNKFNKLWVDLRSYVASNFITGFTWDAYKVVSRDSVPFLPKETPLSACRFPLMVPPPPPPPSPAVPLTAARDSRCVGDAGREALLMQLNRGTNIIQNLRPVRDRAPHAVVQAPTGPGVRASFPSVRASAATPTHPPKFLLEGRKWVVEYQKDRSGLTIENLDMGESVAMFKCEKMSLNVVNKINSVTIDSCKQADITVHGVISSVEMIRCDRVRLQCDGNVPLISVDNCESIQIFLRHEARGVEIIFSKSSSCNVCLLEEDGDYKELAMPEQIKCVLVGDKLESSVIDKY